MKLLFALWLGIMLLFAPPQAFAATQRFALVLGNNLGFDKGERLRYAERDARKFHSVLTSLGGFNKEDTTLLLNADSDKAWTALKDIERRLVRRGHETGDKTMLLVYYSGHAEGDVLELGETSLSFVKLREFLKSSEADVRLAFLDSCLSGKIISVKGGRRGPGFNIKVTDEITSTGYAIITSSAHDELSQESAELRGSFFTHYLVSALMGAGDESSDGKVTLAEAYKYVYSRTLARTSVTVGGSQHPMYHFRLKGRGEIVLTNTDSTGAHVSVTLPEKGRLILLDVDGENIIAETNIKDNTPAILSVPPGAYLAYLITPQGSVREAEFNVGQYGPANLGADDFHTTVLETGIAKGGLFKNPDREWEHRVGAGGLWRLWPLEGADASYGVTIHYRLLSPRLLQPLIRLTWATRDNVGVSTNYNDMSAVAGVGFVREAAGVFFRTELMAGYEHMFQGARNGVNRHTSGFDYAASVGVELPAGGLYFCLDGGVGGRIFQVIGKGWVHRFDFQASLGLGWKWGQR